jgi:hypothetical protein
VVIIPPNLSFTTFTRRECLTSSDLRAQRDLRLRPGKHHDSQDALAAHPSPSRVTTMCDANRAASFTNTEQARA